MRPHPVPVDNIQLQADGVGDIPRRLRHPGGRHYVGRVIDQIPRQHCRLRQRSACGHAGGQSVNVAGVPFYYGHPLNTATTVAGAVIVIGTVPPAAVSVKPIQPQQRTLGNGLRHLPGILPADAGAVGNGGKLRHALAPQEPAYLPADPPHDAGVKIRDLAQPGHRHAPGRHTAHCMQQRHFARLALDFAVGNEGGNRPIQRAVNGPGAAAGLRNPLEQVDDQGRRGKVGDVAGNDINGNGSHKITLLCGDGGAPGIVSGLCPDGNGGASVAGGGQALAKSAGGLQGKTPATVRRRPRREIVKSPQQFLSHKKGSAQ